MEYKKNIEGTKHFVKGFGIVTANNKNKALLKAKGFSKLFKNDVKNTKADSEQDSGDAKRVSKSGKS